MNQFNLDARELPKAWPSAIRARTEAARGIRANPILKTLIEGLWIERVTGSPVGFTEHVAIEYIRRHGGDTMVEKYKSIDYASHADELLELADGAGRIVSPLTVALSMSFDLQQIYAPAPHVRLISDAIVDAVSGRGPLTVLVSLHPRASKSETAGRRTLDFLLANYPGFSLIYCSATDILATTMGRLVKNDINTHAARLGFELADDSSASGKFSVAGFEGSNFLATGVTGQLSGFGASGGLVLDDLFKSSEQAESPLYRDQVWALWQSVLQPRKSSGSLCSLIGTRFHEADLHGLLLNGTADVAPIECRYIRLPALAEGPGVDEVGRSAGEALPRGPVIVPGFLYTKEELLERKSQTDSSTWSSLYQQDPVSAASIGRCYDAFDPAIHVREAVDFDRERDQVLVGFDFNVRNYVIEMAFKRSVSFNRHYEMLSGARYFELYFFKELALGEADSYSAASVLIETLRELRPSFGPMRIRVTGDATGRAADTTSKSLKSDWEIIEAELSKHDDWLIADICVPKSNPGVKTRVNGMNGLLKSAAGGNPRVYIAQCCKQLILDLKSVKWKRDRNGGLLPEQDGRDKERTHGSDSASYLATNLVLIDEPMSRGIVVG